VSTQSKRTIAICACVAVAGLALAQGSFTGDTVGAITGYLLFELAVAVAVFAALLGDRSNLSDWRRRTRIRSIPRPGFVAIGLSSVLALIALIALSQQMRPLECASVDLPPTHAKVIPGTISFESSETRAFPPGRICRGYALTETQGGGRRQVFLGETVVPAASDYIAALLLVVAPLALSMGWRASRLRVPGPAAAGHVEGA
jgi:hypothetical protein